MDIKERARAVLDALPLVPRLHEPIELSDGPWVVADVLAQSMRAVLRGVASDPEEAVGIAEDCIAEALADQKMEEQKSRDAALAEARAAFVKAQDALAKRRNAYFEAWAAALVEAEDEAAREGGT